MAQQIGQARQCHTCCRCIFHRDIEVHVGHVHRATVAHGGGTALQVQIALAVKERQLDVTHRQAGDTSLRQRDQFTGVGCVVAIGVAPDHQLPEGGIGITGQPVAIAVVSGKACKTSAFGSSAEEFTDAVDPAIAVFVDSQEGVARRDPT